jgi:release factor glutamine methyltransferase
MALHHPLRTKDQEPTTRIFAEQNAQAVARAKNCRSAIMPSLNHLHMNDYQNVYEPSDDTYLLIDAIGLDIDIMDKVADNKVSVDADDMLVRSNIKRTLEMGCGTGVPSIYLAMRMRGLNESDKSDSCTKTTDSTNISENYNVVHYVTDINPDAIRIAKATAEVNGILKSDFKAHQCDLASDLIPELENSIDILIFNPPYVPTPDAEVGSNGIEASWAGGTNGRVVLDRALPQMARLLAYPHGVGYLVTVDDNYPEELAQSMLNSYGITVVPWLRRKARNEFLSILRLTPTRRKPDDARQSKS